MKLFARDRKPPLAPAPPSFGAWALRQVAQGESSSAVPFSRLEQLLSNTASLVCGAVHGSPESFRTIAFDPATRREAALVARRTADGFRASLADRDHAVLAWPWDHIATRVAWLGTQSGELDEERLGRTLEQIACAYALAHEEQLRAVIGVWRAVAGGVTQASEPPNLEAMGLQVYLAFVQATAA